jgi:YebC/PmpR family DNA-binding regulatory protein
MSGHSKWSQIKHKKGATDQKRGQVFSKLLSAVTVAAKTEPNPDFNPRLRSAVTKAKENKVPADNIERAIKRASESGGLLEELILEAYGPGGSAILIEALTDNRNRTVAEVKKTLNDSDGKWAESGSVRWAFDEIKSVTDKEWRPKFPQKINEADKTKLDSLVVKLEDHPNVQKVYTNSQ